MNSGSKQPGFVLVMTLIIVILAGIALVAVSRRSCEKAIQAVRAESDLQRRWMTHSLQQHLLPRAEQWLTQIEEQTHEPCHTRRIDCVSDSMSYTILLTDEQARFNVNRLRDEQTHKAIECVRRLARRDPSGIASATVRLRRPSTRLAELDEALGRIISYDQVFENPSAAWIVGEPAGDGLMKTVTCWTDGRINFTRSPDPVIREATRPILGAGAAEHLVNARRAHPDTPPLNLLRRLPDLAPRQRRLLTRLFTDESSCYGLWVIAANSHRRWYHLRVVMQPQDEDDNTESSRNRNQPTEQELPKPIGFAFDW